MNRVPWPLKDGGSIAMYNSLKAFRDAGCELTIAAMNTTKHFVPMDQLPAEVSVLGTWHTVPVDNRVKRGPALLSLIRGTSYHVERFMSGKYSALLKELLVHHTYDIVFFDSLFVAGYADEVRRQTGARLVLRQHNVESDIWKALAAGERSLLKKFYLQRLAAQLEKFEREALNKFDHVLAFTAGDERHMRDMGCHKPVTIAPVGIDTERLKPDHSKLQQGSYFHLGSMEWRPNLEAVEWFLDKVWMRVVGKHPRLRLVIAGRGMPAEMKTRVVQNVEMAGEVTDATTFMQRYEVMIVPLFSGSGIRVKILEGLALGKVIISTTLGAQGIAYEKNVHLFIADTAEEMLGVIDKLAANPQIAAAVGRTARKLAEEHYDNRRVIQRVLTAITQ
jgi:glycosyltransferase involved in cell wall biosynthesis